MWHRLLACVEARDARGALVCFAPNGSWQNVPHRFFIDGGEYAVRCLVMELDAESGLITE